MATNKNITMKQFNEVDYDTLYPKTIAAQIDDVYSKDETSNLFLPKAGGSMGGILDMNGNRITNLPSPTSNSDPATKEYVDGKSSKILSEKIIVNEDLGLGGFKAIELKNKIDVNDANAIGIKITFNNTLTITNTDSRNNRNFYIRFFRFDICYASVRHDESLTYANAGQSVFIPLFILPISYATSSFNYGLSTGRAAFPISAATNDFRVLSSNFNPNNQDIQLSVDNSAYTSGLNITFDIYKIYF